MEDPQLNVYDKETAMANNPGGATANPGQAVVYDQSENTVRFHFGTTNPASFIAVTQKLELWVNFMIQQLIQQMVTLLMDVNLRLPRSAQKLWEELNYYVECSTAGMNFPDSDFSLALTTGGDTDNQARVYSSESTAVEAFFEGLKMFIKAQLKISVTKK